MKGVLFMKEKIKIFLSIIVLIGGIFGGFWIYNKTSNAKKLQIYMI